MTEGLFASSLQENWAKMGSPLQLTLNIILVTHECSSTSLNLCFIQLAPLHIETAEKIHLILYKCNNILPPCENLSRQPVMQIRLFI